MIRTIVKWGTIAGAASAIFLFADQVWGSGFRPLIKFEFDHDNQADNETITDLRKEIGLVVDKISLIEWELLYTKMKTEGVGSMTFDELQKLCRLTRQLDYTIPECPNDGD